ncbi:MAG: glyoxalase [Dehalococcoidia bacterium]|nr:glyoxalase [Dehalococcoidia bacterium]
MIPTRITTVHLGVHDVPKLRAFYNALGWTEANPDNKHFAEYKGGGAWLSLFPHALLSGDAKLTDAPPAAGQYRGLSLGLNVERREQVDEALATAKAAGGRIVKEPVDTSWGGRSGYFADPEGNLWEMAWSPRSQFDARGGLIA